MKRILSFLTVVNFLPSYSMEIQAHVHPFLLDQLTEPEVNAFNIIMQPYQSKVREILNHYEVLIPKTDKDTLFKLENTIRNIERNNFFNAYRYLEEFTTFFRTSSPKLTIQFTDQLVSKIYSQYMNATVFDKNFSALQKAFRLAIFYDSNKIYSEITQIWYIQQTLKKLTGCLKTLNKKLRKKDKFSQSFGDKMLDIRNKIQSHITSLNKDSSNIFLLPLEAELICSTLRYYITVISLTREECLTIKNIDFIFRECTRYQRDLKAKLFNPLIITNE